MNSHSVYLDFIYICWRIVLLDIEFLVAGFFFFMYHFEYVIPQHLPSVFSPVNHIVPQIPNELAFSFSFHCFPPCLSIS